MLGSLLRGRKTPHFMTVPELLQAATVKIPLLSREKDGVLLELTEHLCLVHHLSARKEDILTSLRARERLMSTGIGRGVAIPHAELDPPIPAVAVVGISRDGIDFGSADGKPVHVVFLLALGREAGAKRVEVLSILCRIFRKESVREEVRTAKSGEEVLAVLAREEEALRRSGHAGATVY